MLFINNKLYLIDGFTLFYLCLSLLWAFSRKGSGFSDKARRRKAPKPAKVFIYVYVRKL